MPQVEATTQSSVRRTQAERKARSDARIIAAAVELFSERGYVRTTINDIGTRAGYSGGLVSKRYGSKVGLLRAVLDDIYQQFTDQTNNALKGTSSSLEQLETWIDVFAKRISKREGRVRALYAVIGESFGAVPEIQEPLKEFDTQTIDGVAGMIKRGIKAGEFRDDLKAKETATLLLALMRGLTFLHLSQPDRSSITKLRKEIHKFLVTLKAT